MRDCNSLEINVTTLRRNIAIILDYAKAENPSVKYCLPVKANAYGHGLIEVAQATADIVDCFGVACADEGISLRQSGVNNDILVFGAYENTDIPRFIEYNLEITISSIYKAEAVIEYCKANNKTAKIHIKIDTGMNRVGIRANSAYDLIQLIVKNSQFIEFKGLYSHLACADSNKEMHKEFTISQIETFKEIVTHVKALNPNIVCHLSNSAGLNYTGCVFDMIRPGLISYGYNINKSQYLEVLPALSLKSKVVYFKVVEANQGISYGHQYYTNCRTRVVTIPIGYGDGYRLAFSDTAPVIINDQLYHISGKVCMDMCMVDIGQNGTAYVGDEVTLIGSSAHHQIKIETLAEIANTHIYEILCGFNARISRKYVELSQ
jgi:alanine racemase